MGVINEPGGTGTTLKLTGIEFSGKSGTAQVIGYDTRARFGKQKKFEDNAWFVGYAPKRNPEIAVAVLVQESGQHGGEASGPVVRDIIKAYYDKKNKSARWRHHHRHRHHPGRFWQADGTRASPQLKPVPRHNPVQASAARRTGNRSDQCQKRPERSEQPELRSSGSTDPCFYAF